MSHTLIDDYLKNVKPSQKVELERVRKIIHETVPDVEEVISYGMPVFKYKGKYLLGMCEFKNHLSIFPGAGAVEALKGKLDDYMVSKGTIQFTLEKPLPESIITEAVRVRLADIAK